MEGLPDSANADYKILLEKMENTVKNLKDKKDNLENLLNN
jgi:hypothetical protein